MHSKFALLLTAASLLAAGVIGQQAAQPKVGRTPSDEEIKQQDITVLPTGAGLPAGSGTPDQGEAIYKEKCAGCHGQNGEGKPPTGVTLVGGVGTLATAKPVKTVGSYWPYATSVWDYIHRSMPYTEPGTLTADETYALTAFLLFKNGIVAQDQALNAETLPKVRMPNRDGFIPDTRPDVGKGASAARQQK